MELVIRYFSSANQVHFLLNYATSGSVVQLLFCRCDITRFHGIIYGLRLKLQNILFIFRLTTELI